MRKLIFGNNKKDFLAQNDSLPPGVFYTEQPVATETDETSVFLMGEDYTIDHSYEFAEQLKLYSIHSKDFNLPLFTTHLIQKNGKPSKRYLYQRSIEGLVSAQEISLSESEQNILLPKIKPKALLDIIKAAKSNSFIGGSPPENFVFPKINSEIHTQYIGRLSNRDPELSWLPFDFHMIHPLSLSCDQIYYDYSDPKRPQPISQERIHIYSVNNDDNFNTHPLFEAIPISFKERDEEKIAIGEINIPQVQLAFNIPKCPISRDHMRYVASIRFSSPQHFIKAYSELIKARSGTSLENFGFADMGSLHIFFCEKTKTACYKPDPYP